MVKHSKIDEIHVHCSSQDLLFNITTYNLQSMILIITIIVIVMDYKRTKTATMIIINAGINTKALYDNVQDVQSMTVYVNIRQLFSTVYRSLIQFDGF